MQAVLNSALPIFALILTGFLCGRFNVFDRTATDNLNRFAVYLALPALIFTAMSRIGVEQVSQFGFIGAFCGGIAATFATGFAISRLRGRRVANASIEGLDAGYSNVGFMGIPMCLLVFGPDSAPASIIATLFTACVLFLFAIVVVEMDLQKGATLGATIAKVARSLLTSPLFIAPVAGLAVGLSGFALPAPFMSFTTLLGGAASPAALVCIGLFLAQERVVTHDANSIAILVSLKLVMQPAVTALLAFHVFAMPPLWSHSAVILSALPIGSGPFTIAKLYGLEAGVTSGAILVSHIFAVLTVSLLVAWLAPG
ncbi:MULTISPECIES: AEC family transporter [Bradyrhizobium]|jgi:malonate transporter|uniref:AEC family transporter n=3 Tax=Bradyrhizobium TaxID=374 RepID=A0ABS5GII7_9BRAD|nr:MULTISPECIES: AEC family transporter [Bradyrhizobium]RTL93680.1 MAG: AEC family transporter [Bradyrhizobiaceae bacterium]ABQ34217.1 putative malonate transporter [Bradyrhizobium sp. BTAi1]MBR1141068.1 AEC family transporter [Bradyrhizobium denitrificans]MCL8489002.1 AEC family transporter [Bradyrhizobium denitrificans]MDU0960141.1 AEC family transporter [Bradyrhizobium sp.]